MRSVVVDSGPLVALFSRTDHWHPAVLAWLEANPKVPLATTWPVVTEVCAMLSRHVADAAARDFLRWIERGGLMLESPAASSFHAVLEITIRFHDLPLDFADASVAELAARLGVRDVLTIDSDFDVYRDTSGKALRNLLAGGGGANRRSPRHTGKPRK